MNKEERQLLCCLRAYRTGEAAAEIIESLSPEEWRRLYELSAAHKLTAVVFEMLHGREDFCSGDPALAGRWKRDAILQAVAQTGRTQKLLELTAALDGAGVRYALVKGAICRQLYHKGDLRPSGDEDLFIPPSERQYCGEVFARHGLRAVSPQEEADVAHWHDPATGLHLELHTRQFSTGWTAERILNPYFEQQLEHTVTAAVEHTAVQTLQPTAHLLFLIAHTLKHFITGGFGVRTLSDLLSYCERYQEQIDHRTLWDMLERIRGAVFFRQLLQIGQLYLDFDAAPWGGIPSDPSDGNELLGDMLAAGIYGQTSMDRRHSGALALQTAQGRRTAPSLRGALFPPASQLKGRYPILRKAPVLLPVMWLHRMGHYGLELLRADGTENSPWTTLSQGKQRTEMMVKYGILPQAKTEDR